MILGLPGLSGRAGKVVLLALGFFKGHRNWQFFYSGVTMTDVVLGVLPHVLLVMCGLAIFVAFPEIITWLPSQMIK